MSNGILRTPTPDELRDMEPLQLPGAQKVVTPRAKFELKMAEEEKKANKKSLPFAISALRVETADDVSNWEKRWKRRGYVDIKKDPYPTVDWDRYSNLKNFEILEEDEKLDASLSDKHRLPITIRYMKYKFKGFKNTYTIMEEPSISVDRAYKKITERRTPDVIPSKKTTTN